jgi:hypothetical protein
MVTRSASSRTRRDPERIQPQRFMVFPETMNFDDRGISEPASSMSISRSLIRRWVRSTRSASHAWHASTAGDFEHSPEFEPLKGARRCASW